MSLRGGAAPEAISFGSGRSASAHTVVNATARFTHLLLPLGGNGCGG